MIEMKIIVDNLAGNKNIIFSLYVFFLYKHSKVNLAGETIFSRTFFSKGLVFAALNEKNVCILTFKVFV